MKFTNSALQLLMLYRLASASPCKPSSVLPTSNTDSALSTSVAISTSVQATETSTTFLSQPTTTESEATSDPPTTSSSEPSTTAASTTTTAALEPTNILVNPGFEENTLDPWQKSGVFGTIQLSDESFEGDHSGHFIQATSPGGPADLGFRQNIDPSLIKPDTVYQFSVQVKTMATRGCYAQYISCSNGGAYFNSQSFGGSVGQWTPVTTTCSWSEARLSQGPSIEVRGTCEVLDFYMDEVVLVESSTNVP